MSLAFMESFADDAAKWSHLEHDVRIPSEEENASHVLRGIDLDDLPALDVDSNNDSILTFPPFENGFVLGFYILRYSTTSNSTTRDMLSLGPDGASAGASPSYGVRFRINGNGSNSYNMEVIPRSGGSTLPGGTYATPNLTAQDGWRLVELVCDPQEGKFQFWQGLAYDDEPLQLMQEWEGTIVPEELTTIAVASLSQGYSYIGSIYVLELDGNAPNERLGHHRIEGYLVEGPGHHNDFARSDSEASLADLVNDPSMETYISGTQVGDKQTFDFEGLPDTTAVRGVQIAAKVNQGGVDPTRFVKLYRDEQGAEAQVGDPLLLPEGMTRGVFWTSFINPLTGQPWQIGDLNYGELGFEWVPEEE